VCVKEVDRLYRTQQKLIDVTVRLSDDLTA